MTPAREIQIIAPAGAQSRRAGATPALPAGTSIYLRFACRGKTAIRQQMEKHPPRRGISFGTGTPLLSPFTSSILEDTLQAYLKSPFKPA